MLGPVFTKPRRSFSNGNCLEARWAASTRSTNNGQCVQAQWAKSSHSNSAGGNCVEARLGGAVQVRDSKNPGPVLSFTPAAWDRFLTQVKAA